MNYFPKIFSVRLGRYNLFVNWRVKRGSCRKKCNAKCFLGFRKMDLRIVRVAQRLDNGILTLLIFCDVMLKKHEDFYIESFGLTIFLLIKQC